MIGIDEAGRGAWAGPLVVAAVMFSENPGFIKGLDDSKRLRPKVRESLAETIKSSAIVGVAQASPEEVDQLGLTRATSQCILEVLKQMPKGKPIIIDGRQNFLAGTAYDHLVTCEVKADQKRPAVMAASIIAKVSRDLQMQASAKQFPGWGFDSHVGYGTARHLHELISRGPIKGWHRFSFEPIRGRQK